MVRTNSGVFEKVCEDASAAFLCGVSFVGRAYRFHLLFDLGLDHLVEPRVRRLSLAQSSLWGTMVRAFLDRRVE